MLITFEGIDGSGKSTQIKLLKEKLVKLGFRAEVFREPGGTRVSELIRSILLNPDLEVDPVSELLLFSAARAQLISEQVRPLLNKDVIVILDRFYDSTVSYQGYGRESLPIDQIHQINKIATGNLVPDVTFYLKVNPEVARQRTENESKDRMEQAGEAFFRKVSAGFDELAEQNKRFKTVDAHQKAENIHAEIMRHLAIRLPKHQ